LDARTEFKILEPSPKGGVEAGRAYYCSKAAKGLSNPTIVLNKALVEVNVLDKRVGHASESATLKLTKN
jgi:hypothetical protein